MAEEEIPHHEEKKIMIETKKLYSELQDLFEDTSKDKQKKLQDKIFKIFGEENAVEWTTFITKGREEAYKQDAESMVQQIEAQQRTKAVLENLCKDLQNKNLELYEENKSIKLKEDKIRKELQKKMKKQAKEATERIEKKSNEYQILLKENEHYQKCLNEIIPKLDEKSKAIKSNMSENSHNIANLFQDVHQKLMTEISNIVLYLSLIHI